MGSYTQAHVQAARFMSALNGKELWTCRRAADMATFQFGARTTTKDYYGRPSEVGEYALHVQCAWRFVRDDQIVVGSSDLYYPAQSGDQTQDEIPANFDWDRHPNRRDRLLEALFKPGSVELVVQRIELGAAGSLHIGLSEGLSLEVFPDNSLPDEHWRLLTPASNGQHLVVAGRGISF